MVSTFVSKGICEKLTADWEGGVAEGLGTAGALIGGAESGTFRKSNFIKCKQIYFRSHLFRFIN